MSILHDVVLGIGRKSLHLSNLAYMTLVEEGLRALLFGRVKQFRRGGGYTPNLEKHILGEGGKFF